MIKLKTTDRYDDVPDSLDSAKSEILIQSVIDNADGGNVKTLYNSDSVRQLFSIYHGNKCVYCESIPIASSAFRIDHYRPKDKIDGILPTVHKGYYWLGYEWTNLLQSCEICNGKKSNKFPLDNDTTRVNPLIDATVTNEVNRNINSPVLMAETRLLLHPELDDVESCLEFKPDGNITGTNNKGKETIKVLGLDRSDLVLMRKKKIDKYWNDLIEILNDFEDRGGDSIAEKFLGFDLFKYFKKLLKEQDHKEEYSRLGFFMFHEFEFFYLNKLPLELQSHKTLVKAIYLNIKNGV